VEVLYAASEVRAIPYAVLSRSAAFQIGQERRGGGTIAGYYEEVELIP
jgi:hypothetical protein